MTLKQQILDLFDLPLFESGVVYVCDIIKSIDKQKQYTQQDWARLNSSVSSQIAKFVKAGVLEVVSSAREFGRRSGPRGGQVYRKTKPNEKTVSILKGLID